MKSVNIKQPELLKPLTEVEVDDTYLDLHNDFYCTNVAYDANQNIIKMYFEGIGTQKFKEVIIMLENTEVTKMILPLYNDEKNKLTLDTFYRGRFEKEGHIYEFSVSGKGYYYIDFDEGYSIETFASKIMLFLAIKDES